MLGFRLEFELGWGEREIIKISILKSLENEMQTFTWLRG
jgi:hypothetical protein